MASGTENAPQPRVRMADLAMDESCNLIDSLKREYFIYICNLVGIEEPNRDTTYWFLAKRLNSIEFYWTVPNDDNRATDGKNLRMRWLDIFENENGRSVDSDTAGEVVSGPCTVLEMMIGLAIRCETDIMMDDDEGDRTKQWFWEMIRNLGLEDCSDDHISQKMGDTINYSIQIALEREYDRYGHGGFWPLKWTKKDQRKVEIWYQMCAYLEENYHAYLAG